MSSVSLESLLAEFECFICMEYMHPPIRQCTSGHSICEACSNKVDSCPTCKASLASKGRNFALEKIHDQITFPCKYHYTGCDAVINGKDIISHENKCESGPKTCPLFFSGRCKWVGNQINVVEHCRTVHSKNTVEAVPYNDTICAEFLTKKRKNYIKLFYVHNEIFIFFSRIEWKEKHECLIRCTVFLISNPKKNVFKFEVKFENDKGQNITLKAPCVQVNWVDDKTFATEADRYSFLTASLGYCGIDMTEYSLNIKKI